jgi:hypothetical protein
MLSEPKAGQELFPISFEPQDINAIKYILRTSLIAGGDRAAL